MKNRRINLYLIGSILALSVLPLLASYVLLDEVLQSATSMITKPQTQTILQNYRDDLKLLKTFDPDKADVYKARFLQTSDELIIYEKPGLLQQVLRDTYLTYYLVLFALVLILSLVAAIWLSQNVARSYKTLLISDLRKAEKLQELSHFNEWQLIAGKLAHEINNPLTPIEMMVSNLNRVYLNADPKVFKDNLNETTSVVSEEVYKLKEMVSHFSQFAKLPEPVLKQVNIAAYCERFITQHQNGWPVVKFTVLIANDVKDLNVKMDHLLINQCLINIINNAVQANPIKETLQISMSLNRENSAEVSMVLFNEGVKIDNETQKHIFKMHYSSKKSIENMGLGLAIVKKILLDHNGDIICLPLDEGAAFKINLPVSESLNDG